MVPACSAEPQAPQLERPLFSLIAVGDTGRNAFPRMLAEGQIAVARGMAQETQRSPVDVLVLLGDIFYWDGLTRNDLFDEIRDKIALPYCRFVSLEGPRSESLRSVCRTPGTGTQLYPVLGNHDIRAGEGIQLFREVVGEYISNWNPTRSYADHFELGHGISLISFESELHLTEGADAAQLTDAIRNAPGPWRIVAAHRPTIMGERGDPPRGGFPDQVRQAIIDAGVPVHVYLSGHEHNLQLFVDGPPGPAIHVIAGSGSRTAPLIGPDLPGRRYAGEHLGFARIDLLEGPKGERLAVSLHRTARLPIFSWAPPRLVARWSVAPDGKAVDLLADPIPES